MVAVQPVGQELLVDCLQSSSSLCNVPQENSHRVAQSSGLKKGVLASLAGNGT